MKNKLFLSVLFVLLLFMLVGTVYRVGVVSAYPTCYLDADNDSFTGNLDHIQSVSSSCSHICTKFNGNNNSCADHIGCAYSNTCGGQFDCHLLSSSSQCAGFSSNGCVWGPEVTGHTCDGDVNCSSYSADICPTNLGCVVNKTFSTVCEGTISCESYSGDDCPSSCQETLTSSGHCSGGSYDCSEVAINGGAADGACGNATDVCETTCDDLGGDCPNNGDFHCVYKFGSNNCGDIASQTTCNSFSTCTWHDPEYVCTTPTCESQSFQVTDLTHDDCNKLDQNFYSFSTLHGCVWDVGSCTDIVDETDCTDAGHLCQWESNRCEPSAYDRILSCSNYCGVFTSACLDPINSLSCSESDCANNVTGCNFVYPPGPSICTSPSSGISCPIDADENTCNLMHGCTLNNKTATDCHGFSDCSPFDSEDLCNGFNGCTWGSGEIICNTVGTYLPSSPTDCNDTNSSLHSLVTCVADSDGDGFYPQTSPNNFTVCADDPNSATACGSAFWNVNLGKPPLPQDAVYVGMTGKYWDQDDNDYIITYLKCPAGKEFVYVKQAEGVNRNALLISTNDMSLASYLPGPIGKYFGGCADSTDYCVEMKVEQNSIYSGQDLYPTYCVPAGTVWTDYNIGKKDSKIYCLNTSNAFGSQRAVWIDVDNSSLLANLTNYSWLQAGEGVGPVGEFALPSVPSTSYPPVNGYATFVQGGSGVFNSNIEFPGACGDDPNEYISTGICDGFDETLCCPQPGMIAYNGFCLNDTSLCPDIQRGPPVFVSANGTLLSSFEAQSSSNGGFCCESDGAGGFDAKHCYGSPMVCNAYLSNSSEQQQCDNVDQEGCFVSRQSVYTPTPPPSKTWCMSDSECVFGKTTEPGLGICEVSKVCNDSLFATTVRDSDLVCSDYNVTPNNLDTRVFYLKANCGAGDAHDCISEEVTVCDKTVGMVCDEDGYACHYLYDENSCRKITTYHGPECWITSGCALHYDFYDPEISLPTVSGNGSMGGGVDTQIPDTSSCHNAREYFLKNNPSLFKNGPYVRVTNCETNDYCLSQSETPNADTVFCLGANNSLGAPIRLVDRTSNNPREIGCIDWASQTKGDYWCPKGYLYDDANNVCYKSTAFCDQGYCGNLEHGCDNPFSPQDDDLFHSYQKDCVFKKSVPVGVNAYDSFCCLDTVFNGFQIWREERDLAHVKVY